MIHKLFKTIKSKKLAKAEIKKANWTPLSDEHIKQEYEWEYPHIKKRFGDVFPTLDHFKTAVKNSQIVPIDDATDSRISNRSHSSDLQELKDLVSTYRYPRDVDSIAHGLKTGASMPTPLVLRHPTTGNMHIMSGNTRMDTAGILGYQKHATVVDIPTPENTKVEKSEDLEKGQNKNKPASSKNPIFFHGTKADISKFDKPGTGMHGNGYYFTKERQEAKYYSKRLAGDGSTGMPSIYHVELNVSKPFNTMSPKDAQNVATFHGHKYKAPEFAGGAEEHYHHLERQLKNAGIVKGKLGQSDINQKIKEAGFDHLHYDFMGHKIVFDPNNIKIVNKENSDNHEASIPTLEEPKIKIKKSEDLTNTDNENPLKTIADHAKYWQQGSGNWEDREALIEASRHPAFQSHKKQMVDKLIESGVTHRVLSDGSRHLLLHRGVGNSEIDHNRNDFQGQSWTSSPEVAKNFADSYDGKTVKKWIPERNIHFSMEHGYLINADTHGGESEVVTDSDGRTTKELNDYQKRIAGPTQSRPGYAQKIKKPEDLEKGQNGDWQKEGIKIRHYPSPGYKNRISVDALHPSQMDKYGIALEGKGKAGFAMFLVNQKDKTLEPLYTDTDINHRRKGVASAMYDHVEKQTGFKVIPGRKQSSDAGGLWSQPSRSFGKSEDLTKGQNGDWASEGYTLHHQRSNEDHLELPGGVMNTHITAKTKDGKPIGWLNIETYGPGRHGIGMVKVDPEHQRKGIASAMYSEAEKNLGNKLNPSHFQSSEGEALWNQPNRPFGKPEVKKSLPGFSSLKKSENLEKRSKNVRNETRNITPEQAEARRINYSKQLGINPVPKEESKKDSYHGFPDQEGNTLIHGTAFPIEHELAHALMTPKGETISTYTKKLSGADSAPESKTEENIANQIENRIDRRAGVGVGQKGGKRAHANSMRFNPQVPARNDQEADAYKAQFNIKAFFNNNKEAGKALGAAFGQQAKDQMTRFDNGAKFNETGEVVEPTNVNAKINAKVKKSLPVFGALKKSKKGDLQSLGSDPKGAEVVDFAHNKLRDTLPNGQPGHENWSNWYVGQYKKNPSIHTPENQEKLTHYMGMKHIPEVSNFKFSPKHDTFDSGVQGLSEAASKGAEKAKSEENRYAANQGKKEIDLGGGWGWWNLGVPYSEEEGKAMNHCGNVEGRDGEGLKDKLWSLRQEDPSKPGMAKPHVTVVNNGGYLGEIKGHSNNKPSPKFHDAMVALLTSKHVNGVVGSGYAPEANFNESDLTPEQRQKIIEKNPRMFTPDKSELPKKYSERNDLNPQVTDIEKSARRYNDPEAKKIVQEMHNKKYNTPAKIRKALDNDDDRSFRSSLINNPAITPEHFGELVRYPNYSYSDDQYEEIKDTISKHPLMNDPSIINHIIQDDKYNYYQLIEKGLLSSPHISDEHFKEAVKHVPASVAHYNGNDKRLTEGMLHDMVFIDGSNPNRRSVQGLAKNPNMSSALIQKIQDAEPITSASFLAKNPNFNQSHLDDLMKQQEFGEVLSVMSQRHDLKVPKSDFDELLKQSLALKQRDGEELIHSIKDHPLFDSKNIDQALEADKSLGYNQVNLLHHEKSTPEQKDKIRQDFYRQEIMPRYSAKGTSKGSVEKYPIFQEKPDFYKDEHSKHNPGTTRWSTPKEEHDNAMKTFLQDPKEIDDEWHFWPKSVQSVVANHPNTPDSIKIKMNGEHLSDDTKFDLIQKGYGYRFGGDVKFDSLTVDKVIQKIDEKMRERKTIPNHDHESWDRSVEEVGNLSNIFEENSSANIHITSAQADKLLAIGMSPQNIAAHVKGMTPELADKLIAQGGVHPVTITDHLTDKQRAEYAGKANNKKEAFDIMVGYRKDVKELPLSAFKPFYRGVTEDSPDDEIDIAHEAMENEQDAREHQLLTRTLGPNAKQEDLEKYKHSHNGIVSKTARDEIKRREGLGKSDNALKLFESLKKSKKVI